MSEVEQVTAELKKKKSRTIPADRLLSSGSTLFNLASTGRPIGCFAKGHYYVFIGDSSSGKTWLALQAFAEAAKNPNFADYRLIYDNVEDGALMDLERYFGAKAAKRIRPPRGTKADPQFSDRIEDFFDNVHYACEHESEKPFLYVLDSMDGLSSEDEEAKLKEQRGARERGKETTGSYGDGKAKKISQNLRNIVRKLSKSGSILIIICQTRDNIGFGAKFDPKTRAGGRALLFYATLEVWTSIRSRIKKIVRKKKRTIGTLAQVRTKKNRITGNDCVIHVPIYRTFGADDVGSMIDFLVEEGYWGGKIDKALGIAVKVNAPEFDYNGSREGLIVKIEEEDCEEELKAITKELWDEIESACMVQRKKRYE